MTTTTADNGTVRGPLRFEVETSSPLVEAGRPFTVYLRVTNPFEVPVSVSLIRFERPVEFIDETQADSDPRLHWRSQFSRPIVKAGGTQNPFGHHVSVAVGSRTGMLGPSAPEQAGEERKMPRPEPTLIQPGNTMVQQITLRTLDWLWFTPATYGLEAVIEYRIDDVENTDAVKVPLNVKAPLPALIAGGLAGAVAGSVVGLLLGRVKWAQALTNMVLAALVIVAFARKKEAQPFVSVEDFYGGLFVGFTVSLAGPGWLDWFVNAGQGLQGPGPQASAPGGG